MKSSLIGHTICKDPSHWFITGGHQPRDHGGDVEDGQEPGQALGWRPEKIRGMEQTIWNLLTFSWQKFAEEIFSKFIKRSSSKLNDIQGIGNDSTAMLSMAHSSIPRRILVVKFQINSNKVFNYLDDLPEEACLSPLSSPGVLDYPVFLLSNLVCSVAHQ